MSKKATEAGQNLLPEFVFAHSSQYLKSTAAQLEAGTDAVLTTGADLVALTEIYTKSRARRLKERGFDTFVKLGEDAGAVWRDTMWEFVYAESSITSGKFYFSKTGRKTEPHSSLFLILRHKLSGHKLMLIVDHKPPHVEGSDGPEKIWNLATARRWAVTLDSIAGVQKRRRQLRKEHNVDAVIVTADWNVNVMRKLVRLWVQSLFPNMQINFSTLYRGKGTLGNRVIDFSLSRNLEVLAEPTVHKIPGSDHRTTRTIYRFAKPAKNPVV